MISKILIMLAGVMGAAGIILAAIGAHGAAGFGLDSAAYILLFHAGAILGGTALLRQGILRRPLALIALTGWALGAIMFSGDIAFRAFTGHSLIAMVAPTGGVLLIVAWLVLGAAAIGELVPN